MLTDLLTLAIPATVTVLVTALLKAISDFVARRRRREPAEAVPGIVLPPGVRPPPRPTRTRRAIPWDVMSRLPPLPWRANPWTASLVGGPLLGFGIGGYFRTKADVVAGIVLMAPLIIGVAVQSERSTGSGWVNAIVYANMALTAAYSYLRAVSSNQRLGARGPSASSRVSAPTRAEVFARELEILAAQRWRVQSESGFEAIVVRQKRPNHALHLALSFVTLYLWAFVWIAQTRKSRRNPQNEYRRLLVDARGRWSVEDVPREPPA